MRAKSIRIRVRIHNTEKCIKKLLKYLVVKEGAAGEHNVVEGQVVAVAGERWAQRTRLVHI
jgi:hypothetical protein